MRDRDVGRGCAETAFGVPLEIGYRFDRVIYLMGQVDRPVAYRLDYTGEPINKSVP